MFLISYTFFASLALGLAIPLNEFDVKWKHFQSQFDKHYEDAKELAMRKTIFAQNLEEIIQHNADFETGLSSYKKGVNQFADRTGEELEKMLGLRVPLISDIQKYNTHKEDFSNVDDADVPEFVDYRKEGAVTPVKDQKKCRSCWAFSAVGSIESSYFLKTKKLVSFSEQQLTDCSVHNFGCNGGWMNLAFVDLQKMGGIASSESYAYTGRGDEVCKFNETMAVAKIEGYKTFNKKHSALKKALVKYGPISIALEVTDEFFDYHEGVLSDNECIGMGNHGVLLVGYGSENGTDYWLVKNSWGSGWGEKGYIRLDRAETNCIQPSDPSVPIVKPIA